MRWPSNDFEFEIQSELDRYRKALERILEIGEDATTTPEDWLQVFKIADTALNPPPEDNGET